LPQIAKIIIIVLMSFSLAGQVLFKKLPDFPGSARDDAFAFHHKGFIYAGFGLDQGFTHRNDWWRYDLATAEWQQLENPPLSPRQYVRGFVIGDSLYLFGGQGPNGEFYGDFYRYSILEDEWKALADPPWGARWAGVGFSIGQTGYLGLGYNGQESFKDLWAYNLKDDTWQEKASLPGPGRAKGYASVLENKALVGAGLIEDSSGLQILADHYFYFPLSDCWEKQDFLSIRGSYFYASSSHQQALLLGGFSRSNNRNTLSSSLEIVNFAKEESRVYDIDTLPFRRGGNFIKVDDQNYFLLWGLDSNYRRINAFYSLELTTPQSAINTQVYPNPLRQHLVWVQCDQSQEIAIFSLAGELVYQASQSAGLVLHSIPQQLQGLYFLWVGKECFKIWVE
jgi:N-acetylneuraminic acid mutarotase